MPTLRTDLRDELDLRLPLLCSEASQRDWSAGSEVLGLNSLRDRKLQQRDRKCDAREFGSPKLSPPEWHTTSENLEPMPSTHRCLRVAESCWSEAPVSPPSASGA